MTPYKPGYLQPGGLLTTNTAVCLDPQPDINLAEILNLAKTNDLFESGVMSDVHLLQNYRSCFHACHSLFEKLGWKFAANIPSFILPSTSTVQDSPEKAK